MMNEGLYFKADSSLRIIDVWEVKQENRRLKIATRNIQTVTFTALLILGHGYIKKKCRSFFENRGADLMNHCTEILTSLFLFMVHGPGGQGKTKRARTSFKHHQLRIMKAHFNINQNPDSRELKMLWD